MTTWRKSSYSGSQGDCVEVGNVDRTVVVRDTKDRAGAVLRVSAETWRAFAAGVRAGDAIS
jgi:hypothetical protein